MSKVAQEIQTALKNSEIAVRAQRRGKAKLPGVPDSVVWIRPEALPVPDCLPLLFELENKGNFSNADRDAIEFGKRHDDLYRSDNDSYEYTLKWPIIAPRSPSTMVLPVSFELLGMSTSTIVTAERDVSEREFHKGIRQYYRNNETAVQTTDVKTRMFGDTETVFWHLTVNIFGVYTREIIVPFITSIGSQFSEVVTQRFPTITLPLGVGVGGGGANRTKTLTQETGVEFPLLPDIYG